MVSSRIETIPGGEQQRHVILGENSAGYTAEGEIISTQTVSSKTRTVETITVSRPHPPQNHSLQEQWDNIQIYHVALFILFSMWFYSTKRNETVLLKRASNRKSPSNQTVTQLTMTKHWLKQFK